MDSRRLVDLREHPRNYRKHPASQVAHIAASLTEHGVYRPVVIARDNTILAGHGVVLAARSLGWTEIPVHALDLLVLPFSNLGLGGIPARNWVWEHAKSSGASKHWILDDNIRGIMRRWKACRVPCDSGPAFAAAEEYTARYSNVGVAGLNYHMACPNKQKIQPVRKNVHIYSCLLIDNALPFRWRGRYNEDTDLCLQVLAAGLCTLQFNVFMIQKMPTMTMKGGNSDELYKGDGRLEMAMSLQRQWPRLVDIKRRFGRPQHVVNWRQFRTPLILRPGIEPPEDPEFGLRLHARP